MIHSLSLAKTFNGKTCEGSSALTAPSESPSEPRGGAPVSPSPRGRAHSSGTERTGAHDRGTGPTARKRGAWAVGGLHAASPRDPPWPLGSGHRPSRT